MWFATATSAGHRPRPRPRRTVQEPPERVGGPADDPQVAAVDAAQVVERAEADLVLELVAAAVGSEEDVMRVGRTAAAAGHLAIAVVAVPDLPGAAR